MAGAKLKYRHLSRSSSHRNALLRNLVTSLFKHESITTTWHKAKEAQRLAEKLVTLGKRNTDATRRRATQIFFEPNDLVPKLFGPIRERYLSRPGGYTRVLRLEPVKEDQAESAILELVDGPRDMRLAMTAKTLSNKPPTKGFNEVTARNVQKVTQFRENGMETLRALVNRMREFKKNESDWDDRVLAAPRRVYLHEERRVREMHYPDPTGDWKLPNNVTQGKRGVSKGARVTRAKGNLPPANRTDVGILEKRVRRQKLSKPRKDESGTEEAEAALAKLSLES